MSALSAPHRYDLGDEIDGQFLAVTRFDRDRGDKVHFDTASLRELGRRYADAYLSLSARP